MESEEEIQVRLTVFPKRPSPVAQLEAFDFLGRHSKASFLENFQRNLKELPRHLK
jgi:hypothetical protein